MTLSATDITVRFAGISAIDSVSVTLTGDEVFGLIGPNGAGKTTMINVLSGFQRPTVGQVLMDGRPCAGRPPAWLAGNGVVRTFQAVRLFRGLTVSENIEAALSSLGVGRMAARRRAGDLLRYMGIAPMADLPANALNYGDERRVGIARALALDPKYLLLDEPAAGMNIGEAEALSLLIKRIRTDFACGILVVEHNMALVMNTCDRLQVLASGRTIAHGTPAEVLADPQFKAAYLGSQAAA